MAKSKVTKKASTSTKKKTATKKKGGPGRPFKKGNKGGPGRPKDTYYQKVMKGRVKKEFFGYLAKYWEMELSEVEAKLKSVNMSMGERMFLKWFLNRVKDPSNGDMEALARMMGINLNKIEVMHSTEDEGGLKIQFISPEGGTDSAFQGYSDKDSVIET